MYDVLLLSIEQPNEIDEKLSYGNLTIEKMNNFGYDREKYYFEKWPFLNNLSCHKSKASAWLPCV